MKDLLPTGEFIAIEKRHLSADSCEKWGYHINQLGGSVCQVADYRNDQGELVAQKVRFSDKSFTILGDAKQIGLYGKHLWREKGKRIILTEGEIDAISISQLQDHKWPVVSIPNGASGAKKAIQADLQYLESFEEVVLCFDNDEPGIAAAKECALLFTPGKCKIATLPLKDANDMLVSGRVKELIDATWAAKTYRPDGIVAGVDMWEVVAHTPKGQNYPTPWPELNERIGGIRKGEITTLSAGSGIGKSQLCREIATDLLVTQKQTVDHFGSLDSDNLVSRIRYLIRGCECDWIILDHISIAVSGIEDGDERRIIDNLMTKLRSLVQETGVGMVLVSHLKSPDGKAHEEGGQTSLNQLRGSRSIGQLSDTVIGVERNQQDEERKHISTLRVLKCRWNGQTGTAGEIRFDTVTGRLKPNTLFAPVGDDGKPKGHF